MIDITYTKKDLIMVATSNFFTKKAIILFLGISLFISCSIIIGRFFEFKESLSFLLWIFPVTLLVYVILLWSIEVMMVMVSLTQKLSKIELDLNKETICIYKTEKNREIIDWKVFKNFRETDKYFLGELFFFKKYVIKEVFIFPKRTLKEVEIKDFRQL